MVIFTLTIGTEGHFPLLEVGGDTQKCVLGGNTSFDQWERDTLTTSGIEVVEMLPIDERGVATAGGQLHDSDLVISVDIAELNRFLDVQGRTVSLLTDLVASIFGRHVMDRHASNI